MAWRSSRGTGAACFSRPTRASEFLRLAYLDLSTKAMTTLTPDVNWDVENLELSPDGRTLAFVTNEAGISRLRLLDTGSRDARLAHRRAAGVSSADSSATRPGTSWHSPSRPRDPRPTCIR